METTDYGCFDTHIEYKEITIYASIHPQMMPGVSGINPTGRYYVYCVHSIQGNCHFVMEQDKNCVWKSPTKPIFVNSDMIKLIGDRIENFNA